MRTLILKLSFVSFLVLILSACGMKAEFAPLDPSLEEDDVPKIFSAISGRDFSPIATGKQETTTNGYKVEASTDGITSKLYEETASGYKVLMSVKGVTLHSSNQ